MFNIFVNYFFFAAKQAIKYSLYFLEILFKETL